MKRIIVLLLLLSMLTSLVACASPVAETTVSETPAQMEAATPAPTPSPTADPMPSPTVMLDGFGITPEDEEILNQQIQNFLNNEGEYSDEKLNGKLFSTKILSERMTNESDLGLITDVSVQGLLLDVREKDNSAVLTLGLKDREGKRFVTCVELPAYFYEFLEGKTGDMEIGFSFYEKEKNYAYSSPVGDPEVFYKADVILNKVEELKGKIIIITPYVEPQIQSMLEYNYDDYHYEDDVSEFMIDFSENVSQRRYLNNKLFYSVWQNDLKPNDEDFSTSNTEVKLIKIESASDINNVNLAYIPIITGLINYA